MYRFVLIVIALLCGLFVAQQNGFFSGDSDASRSHLKVLFIGNSYTYANDLPRMMADIAKSNTDKRLQFDVGSVTQGGLHLIDIWNEGKALTAIQSGHWDYVVLQDQSVWAMFPENVRSAGE